MKKFLAILVLGLLWNLSYAGDLAAEHKTNRKHKWTAKHISKSGMWTRSTGSAAIAKCMAATNDWSKNGCYLIELGPNTLSESSSSFVDNLNKLNDLYKSGALTKEEFEKAKKKLLN